MQFTKSIFLLASALTTLTSAYELTACTDTACSEGCQVFDAPDPDGNGPCLDFGFNAMSIIWSDAGAPLDAWSSPRGGCLDGTGSEDAQFSNGNVEGTCNPLYNAAWASDGVQYYMYAADAF